MSGCDGAYYDVVIAQTTRTTYRVRIDDEAAAVRAAVAAFSGKSDLLPLNECRDFPQVVSARQFTPVERKP